MIRNLVPLDQFLQLCSIWIDLKILLALHQNYQSQNTSRSYRSPKLMCNRNLFFPFKGISFSLLLSPICQFPSINSRKAQLMAVRSFSMETCVPNKFLLLIQISLSQILFPLIFFVTAFLHISVGAEMNHIQHYCRLVIEREHISVQIIPSKLLASPSSFEGIIWTEIHSLVSGLLHL